ncbi:hypothetical protein RF11_01205 [Thelohanellus kitauei]|uniref:Uncharacterized protein n=1 Tax=Thelohanellus kitauei TaxID=669202 RepID=A0A0C2MZN3_THEKT|nr:hypothetical protein RF11_01205 [Thelohanellus kitauei]
MLKLLYSRNLHGRKLHYSIVDNSLSAISQTSKDRLIDIMRFFPFAINKTLHTKGQHISIYPSSDKEYRKMPFSLIKVFADEALRLITERCSLLNIPLKFDQSKLLINPCFSSFNDLDQFTYFLFSENDIYPKKARFYPGHDLLKL